MDTHFFKANELFSRIDLTAIEDADNKIAECKFFLDLAAKEANRERFRWLVSAYLNAAYSYFEMTALQAYFAFTDENGEMRADSDSIEVLRGHICVLRDEKRPNFVKTAGLSPLTKQLYEIRRKNTHHFPLAIMQAGEDLPAKFEFGSERGSGIPVLPFCNQVMQLIGEVQQELDN